MEYKMDEQILQSAIDTYGSRSQHDMLLEEISELQKKNQPIVFSNNKS